MRIVVTGATGFVGRKLVDVLQTQGHQVRAAVRSASAVPEGVSQAVVGEINRGTSWESVLRDTDAVVHLAARVHVMTDSATDPLESFREVNTRGTHRLATECVRMGVRRLVYVSSVKVNGEATTDRPFRESDPPAPSDSYGISKMEAEQELTRVGGASGLETVIVRPPLVYGPGVKANMLSLLRTIDRGIPLPLAAIDNTRTLVGLSNLTDLLARCVESPACKGRVLMAGDGQDISTPSLIRAMAMALGRTPRLFPVPVRWLELAAASMGKKAAIQRLCGSLQVDISSTRRLLDWTPPTPMEAEMTQLVHWYKKPS